MKLTDITNDCDNLIKERIEYIFVTFQKEFSNICYDERSSIVGIGEPNKHLLCYFKKTVEGEILVKFKASDKPISLIENIENINIYINETIEMFKTNNFLTEGKRSKENNAYKREREVVFEYKEIDELIEEIVLTKGEVIIRDIASKRLTNALYNVGIKTISDLKGWTCSKLMRVKNLGEVCLEELYYVFTTLKQERLPEITDDRDIKYLYRKATRGMIKKFAQKENINKYLSLIKFDENQFDNGTIGHVLCLREKVQSEINLYFCEDSNKLHESYLDNIGQYGSLLESTKILLSNIINQIVQNERNKDIVLSLLSIDGKKYTMEELGKRYDITRERVRQIFKKELARLSYGFNLYSEEGILRYILRQNYYNLFKSCPVDSFILYLHIENQNYVLKALFRVLLHGVSMPDDLKDRVKTVQSLLKEKKREATVVKDDTIKYNGFQVILGDDGEILTDLELLSKLKEERLNMAIKLGVPAYWIYHNKHLVLLATFKPLNKKMYSSLRGFTEKTWNDYGSVMVEIIKEHIDSTANERNRYVDEEDEGKTISVNIATTDSMIGKPWGKDEESKLIEEFNQGLKISDIAKLHNRKEGGIRTRLKRLGLIE